MRIRVVVLLMVVLVGVLSSAAAGQDRKVRGWETLMQRGQAARALEMAVGEAEEARMRWGWAMRAARSAGVLEDAAEAGKWLAEAAARGYSGIATVEGLVDFQAVRGDEAFERGVEAVRARAEERMAVFRRAAEQMVPTVLQTGEALANEEPVLVLALHGTGGRGDLMAEAVAALLEGVGVRSVVVGPSGTRAMGDGSSGSHWPFVDEAAWFVEFLIEKYTAEFGIPRGRVMLVGFSQGANIALEMARTTTGVFGGVIAVAGFVEVDRDWDVLEDAARVPVALVVGSRDPWAKNNRGSVELLEEAGFRVRLETLRGRGHAMPSGVLGERVLGEAIGWVLEGVVAGGEGP